MEDYDRTFDTHAEAIEFAVFAAKTTQSKHRVKGNPQQGFRVEEVEPPVSRALHLAQKLARQG